jgi:hypothetical protein
VAPVSVVPSAVPLSVPALGVIPDERKVVTVEARDVEAYRNDWLRHVVPGHCAQLLLKSLLHLVRKAAVGEVGPDAIWPKAGSRASLRSGHLPGMATISTIQAAASHHPP